MCKIKASDTAAEQPAYRLTASVRVSASHFFVLMPGSMTQEFGQGFRRSAGSTLSGIFKNFQNLQTSLRIPTQALYSEAVTKEKQDKDIKGLALCCRYRANSELSRSCAPGLRLRG